MPFANEMDLERALLKHGVRPSWAPVQSPPDLGFVKGNLAKAAGTFGQMSGGALGLFGGLVGNKDIEQYGLGAAEGAQMFNKDINARMMTPEVNPADTYEKKGLWEATKEVPQFVAEQAIQNIPLMIATGGVSGFAARSATRAALAKSAIGAFGEKATISELAGAAGEEATKQAMRRGVLEGATASGLQWTGLEAGSIYDEQKEKNPLQALGFGAIAGFTEAVPEIYGLAKSGLGRKMLGLGAKEAEKIATEPVFDTFGKMVKHTGVDLLKQGAAEGTQEVFQTQMEQLGKSANPQLSDITNREAIKEQILAGIAGAGMGIGMGGAMQTPANLAKYSIDKAAETGKQLGIQDANDKLASIDSNLANKVKQGSEPVSIHPDETATTIDELKTNQDVSTATNTIQTQAQNDIADITNAQEQAHANIDAQEIARNEYKEKLAEDASHPHIQAATSAINIINNKKGSAQVAPEYMVNAVKKLARTVSNVKEFTQGLVSRFGEAIKKHALKLWNWAKTKLKEERGSSPELSSVINNVAGLVGSNSKPVYSKEGINVLRKQGTIEHFGNPFSTNEERAKKGYTVKDAVNKYSDWLEGKINRPDLEPQRQWILKQISEGKVQGKKLLYYKDLGEPSHADALAEFINKNVKISPLNPEGIPNYTPSTLNPVASQYGSLRDYPVEVKSTTLPRHLIKPPVQPEIYRPENLVGPVSINKAEFNPVPQVDKTRGAVTKDYGRKRSKYLEKKTSKEVLDKLRAPRETITPSDLVEQAVTPLTEEQYNSLTELEKQQYHGEESFQAADMENAPYSDTTSNMDLDEALEMFNPEYVKRTNVNVNEEPVHPNPEQRLLESLGLEGKKKPIKQSRALVILEDAKEKGLLNPARNVMVRDDIAEHLNKGRTLTDEFLYNSIKRALEIPEEPLVEPEEEVLGQTYKTIEESVTKEGMSEAEISNAANNKRVINNKVVGSIQKKLENNVNLNEDEVADFISTLKDIQDEDYLVAPIIKEVFGEDVNLSNVKSLPSDYLTELYTRIVSGGIQEEKEFTPERPERFVGAAIGAKERTPASKEDTKAPELSREEHKEKSYEYFKKTYKTKDERLKRALRTLSLIDTWREQGGTSNAKAWNIVERLRNATSEYKGNEGLRLLVSDLRLLTIDNTTDSEVLIQQQIGKYLDKSSFDPNLAMYILGFQLTEDYLNRAQELDASDSAQKVRQINQLGTEAEIKTRQIDELEDDFNDLYLLNKEHIKDKKWEGETTKPKGTPNTPMDVSRVGTVGKEAINSKQYTFDVEVTNKEGERVVVVMSQEELRRRLDSGDIKPEDIKSKSVNKLDVLFSDFSNKDKILAKAYEQGFGQAPETPVFDTLPEHQQGQKTLVYAGIGSRKIDLPENARLKTKITAIAKKLASMGYTLNSGGAKGADIAFENGATKKNIFYAKDATDQTREIAKELHPKPEALTKFPLDLMARNTNQIFGKDLNSPVDFVIAWTPDGAQNGQERSIETGGTGQAIDMAARKGIPVINIAKDGWEQRLRDAIEGKLEVEKVVPVSKNVKAAKQYLLRNKMQNMVFLSPDYFEKLATKMQVSGVDMSAADIFHIYEVSGYDASFTLSKLRGLLNTQEVMNGVTSFTPNKVIGEQTVFGSEKQPIKPVQSSDALAARRDAQQAKIAEKKLSDAMKGIFVSDEDRVAYKKAVEDTEKLLKDSAPAPEYKKTVLANAFYKELDALLSPLDIKTMYPEEEVSLQVGEQDKRTAERDKRKAIEVLMKAPNLAPRSSVQALQDVYSVKAYDTLSSTEKAFVDAMAKRYGAGERPIIGKMRNSLVQSFFEKLAGLFGAEVILVRNGSAVMPSGAKYYPNTTTGKPVLAIDLDSPLSFTRLFAHELFHHVLNKISDVQYKAFKDAIKTVVNKAQWEATVQRMMASRKDITDETKYEIFSTDYINRQEKESLGQRTNVSLEFQKNIGRKTFESFLLNELKFPSWMVDQLLVDILDIPKQGTLPEKIEYLKAKFKSLENEFKSSGKSFLQLKGFEGKLSKQNFDKISKQFESFLEKQPESDLLKESERQQAIKEEIEEELHSEIFSYAFTRPEFWQALSKTFEGRSLASQLTIRMIGKAVEVNDMLQSTINSATKNTPEQIKAQADLDKSIFGADKRDPYGAIHSGNAIRGLVREWFDVKDFVDGKPTYQGGMYEMLALVLDQAYLSNVLRHKTIKSMTTVEVAKGVGSELKQHAINVKDNLSDNAKKIYNKDVKSYKDVMTNIEVLLTRARDWVVKHKPKGFFEDLLRDPKQVEMANRIAYYGNTMASEAYQRVVKKHEDAFKGMSKEELELLHDKVVRTNLDLTEATDIAIAKKNGVTDAQIAAFQDYKKMSDAIYSELKQFYPDLPQRVGHYGQSIRWMKKDSTFVNDNVDWVMSDEKSQLEGAKQFLEGKAENKTTEQIKAQGLQYQTIDPHELFLNYVHDAYKLIAFKEQMDAALANGTAKIFSDPNKALRSKYVPLDDNSTKIFQKMNIDLGYKIKTKDGSYVQQDGHDAIYPSLAEAEKNLYGDEGDIVEPVKPDIISKTTHYSIFRKWEYKGEIFTKEVAQSLTREGAEEYLAEHPDADLDYKGVKADVDKNAVVAQVYLKPDFAALLKVLTSKDKFRNASAFGISGNNIMDVKNAITSAELSMSLFHAFTIGQELVASTAGWSAQRGKGFFKGFNPLAAKRDAREIAVLLQEAMANPEIVSNKSYQDKMQSLLGTKDVDVLDVIGQFFGHGGQLHQDVSLRSSAWSYGKMKYGLDDKVVFDASGDISVAHGKTVDYKTLVDSFTETWNQQVKDNPNSKISAISKTAAFGLLQAPTAWLMEDMIPKLKMSVFAREYTLKLDQQKDAIAQGLTTKEEIAKDTMKFVEDRFGEVNWQNMWMDKSYKTALQFLFRSFTWFSGSFKALGKAGLDIGKLGWFTIKDIGLAKDQKTNYQLTEKGYWGVSALLAHAFTAIAITAVFKSLAAATGADVEPDDEDLPFLTKLLFPRASFEDKSVRLSIPSYITEAYKILSHTGMLGNEAEFSKLVSGRFNGMIGKAFDIYRGEDFRGVTISNKADNLFERVLDNILYVIPKPIAVSSFMQEYKTKGFEPKNLGFALLGLTTAPASALRSEAANKAFEIGRKEYKGKEVTEEDMAEKDVLKRAMFAWQKGDKSKVDELVAEGRVSRRQIEIAKQRYPELGGQKNPKYTEPLGVQLKRLTIEGALDVYDKMSENEKGKYKADIRKKYYNVLARQDKPKVKKEEIKDRMKELGLI